MSRVPGTSLDLSLDEPGAGRFWLIAVGLHRAMSGHVGPRRAFLLNLDKRLRERFPVSGDIYNRKGLLREEHP